MNKFSGVAVTVVAAVVMAACRQETPKATLQTPAVAKSAEAVTRLEPAEVKAALDKNAIVVIDVRDASDYIAGHIPGAMHIPLSYIQGEIPYLPRGRTIVTYCT